MVRGLNFNIHCSHQWYCYLNEQLRYPPHLFLLEYKFAIYASGRTFSPNGMEKIGHIPHV